MNPCQVCGRDPRNKNNVAHECSHVECPHRRRAWSERPRRDDLYTGPWAKNEDQDPDELSGSLKFR